MLTLNETIEYHEKLVEAAEKYKCPEIKEINNQYAAWLKILKAARFEYHEAWKIITHPTPDVTYADRDRAQMILDVFKDSLGKLEG